jgi:sorbitol-specific phosphotransferase system component IIA
MATYETLPDTTRADVDAIIVEFYHHGKEAAAKKFADLTLSLKRGEIVALGDIIRNRLATLGYLEIV